MDQSMSKSTKWLDSAAVGLSALCPKDRQVEGARAGVTVNQGLFGHGSSVICKR